MRRSEHDALSYGVKAKLDKFSTLVSAHAVDAIQLPGTERIKRIVHEGKRTEVRFGQNEHTSTMNGVRKLGVGLNGSDFLSAAGRPAPSLAMPCLRTYTAQWHSPPEAADPLLSRVIRATLTHGEAARAEHASTPTAGGGVVKRFHLETANFKVNVNLVAERGDGPGRDFQIRTVCMRAQAYSS